MATLRVLHVTETFGSGTRAAILGYANAVRAQGVESALLAQDRGIGDFEGVDDSSPFISTRIVPHGLMNLWRAIGPAIEDVRPDIVHFHSSLAGGVGRLRLGVRRIPPRLYSPHCFAFERRDISALKRGVYRGVEFLLAGRTTAFVCVSPHEADLARKLRPRAHIVELINSFGPDRATGTDLPPTIDGHGRRISVVTVGRIAPQKGPDWFVEIVTALRQRDTVDAKWVGDGTASARAVVEANDVDVTGWVPSGQVPAETGGHTVYLHTAGWEAGPVAVLDAITARLPVVVRRNPAYRCVLPEEWQFDDVPSAVRMIRELADKSARENRIREQFDVLSELRMRSPEKVLADAYREILGESHAAQRR